MQIVFKSDILPYANWKAEDGSSTYPLLNHIECSEQGEILPQLETTSVQHTESEYEVSSMPQTLSRKEIRRQIRYLRTLKKLRHFMRLPYGWHHGEGVPPRMNVVLKASELIRFASVKGLSTDVVPSLTGEIQIAIYGDDTNKSKYLELTVGDSVLFNITKYEIINSEWEITDDRELSAIQEVESVIKRFGGEVYPWRVTYGYSLKDTITESSNGFQVKLLGISKEVSQLYRNYVYQTPVIQYAAT